MSPLPAWYMTSQRPIKGLVVFLFLSAFSTRAQAASGTEGASFLDIPVGAAPAAMGSAYSAMAIDAYAPTWNPAGLGFLTRPQLAAQHLSFLESMHHEYLSFVHPLKKGSALGVSAQYLGSGDIAGTDPDGNSIGDYSSHYGAYTLAYGRKISEKLSLGSAAKWINSKLSDVSANAFAADLGAFYRAEDNLSLAATITQIGTRLKFDQQKDPLPLAFHLAAAYRPTDTVDLTLEGIYDKTDRAHLRTGVAWQPLKMFVLRAGYRTDTLKELSALSGFSTGFGVALWAHELAYAWVPYGDLGNTHYVSFLMRLGRGEDESRRLIQFQNIRKSGTAAERASDEEIERMQLMELLTGESREREVKSEPRKTPQ
jgi:hypothetical protein